MRKLMAALLAMLMCGGVAAGEEDNTYTAGLYKFTLPNHTSVSSEAEIADGIQAFVAKADETVFELIGLTVDYKADNPLEMPDGEAADEVHFKNMLQMVIAAEVDDVKATEDGRLRYAELAVDSTDDVKMIAYSRLDEDAGFLLLIAWKQDGKPFQTVERTMTILDAAKSAELLARPVSGEMWIDVVRYGDSDKTRLFPLRKAPSLDADAEVWLNSYSSFKCLGIEGDYYAIEYTLGADVKILYVHKDYVIEREK